MAFNDDFSGSMIDFPDYKTEEISALKVTPIIFMIDISQSMNGRKIEIVNTTMEEIVNELGCFNSSDSEIRFAVLSFGTNCTWETGDSGLIPCDGIWKNLEADGLTYFNTACRELNYKLSGSHGFFNFAAGRTITPPVLILLTDGYANDGNYSPNSKDGMNGTNGDNGIAELKKNRYFNGSFRIAVAIGEGANDELCENFTGDKELVYHTYNAKVLRTILKTVVKTSVSVSSSGISQAGFSDFQPDETVPCTKPLKDGINNELEAYNLEDFNLKDKGDWD